MQFSLIPIQRRLEVEGRSDAAGVGEFRGEVMAMALRGGDPVAEAVPEEQGSGEPEALLGWGVTYFLVCDPSKPSPVWVSKGDVEKHRLAG